MSNELKIKVAETKEEFSQAFELLHDMYVEKGFMEPKASGLRMTPQHLEQSTITIVAKVGEMVVGTATVILDGQVGLTVDKLWDVNKKREEGIRLAEVSSLAFHKSYRCKKTYLFPLFKFLFYVAKSTGKVDELILAVNPRHKFFYQKLLKLTPFGDQVDEYEFVSGAPAVGFTMDLEEYPNTIREKYKRVPKMINLYQYIIKRNEECFEYPTRNVNLGMDEDMATYFEALDKKRPAKVISIARPVLSPILSTLATRRLMVER